MRRGGDEPDRVRVDDLDLLDRLGVSRERPRRIGNLADPVDRERDVLGGEVRPVVKFHALPQLELPGGRVDRLPRLGEPRDEPRIGIERNQLLVDMLGDVVVGKEVYVVRVHRGDVGAHADAQLLGVGAERKRRCEGDQGTAEKAGHGAVPRGWRSSRDYRGADRAACPSFKREYTSRGAAPGRDGRKPGRPKVVRIDSQGRGTTRRAGLAPASTRRLIRDIFSLTRQLAAERGPRCVRANAVPGLVRTPQSGGSIAARQCPPRASWPSRRGGSACRKTSRAWAPS